MANIVLIHGAGHGGWCWCDVAPRLEARGHAVRAIDLPGHGDDRTPAGAITVERYVEAILGAMDGPLVLVGHSLAGMWISAAAEVAPERVARLVYVSAWLPRDGMSSRDLRDEANATGLMAATRTDPDGLTFRFDPAALEGLFYQDLSPEALAFARARVCPEPLAPARTPLRLGANFAAARKAYVRCTRDRAVPAVWQAAATRDWPAGTVFDLPCGHSPFLAMPDRLSEILATLAEAQ